MPIIILAIYGVVIFLACIMFVFPEFRDAQAKRATNIINKSFLLFSSRAGTFRQNAVATSAEVKSNALSGVTAMVAYRHWLGVALLIVLMPALVIVFFKHRVDVGGFSDVEGDKNAVISALLDGEQLVPPPPLPPEVFMTREVLAERPMLVDASRDWGALDATFQQKLLRVFQRMREQGYEMALIEGYRSPDRQDKLAAMGGSVTNAKAFQSYHQYGLAADCAFMRDGRLVISERDPWAMRGYELYGQEAEAAGMTWGGRWKMMDFGHVELRRPGARQSN